MNLQFLRNRAKVHTLKGFCKTEEHLYKPKEKFITPFLADPETTWPGHLVNFRSTERNNNCFKTAFETNRMRTISLSISKFIVCLLKDLQHLIHCELTQLRSLQVSDIMKDS